MGMLVVRRLLNVLALLALAVHSLLPAGFMLAATQAGDGVVAIVICTGHGQQEITVDADGKQVPAKKQTGDAGVCAFAAAASAMLGDTSPPSLETQAHFAALSYSIAREVFRATPKPGANSARGPPSELI